jgi:hypothetical protein
MPERPLSSTSVGSVNEKRPERSVSFLDLSRDQDLPSPRLRRDPGGEDHVFPIEVVLLADRLAGVEPDPHAEPKSVREWLHEGSLDTDRAAQRVLGGCERHHEPVALRLHLDACVRGDLIPDEGVVRAEHVDPLRVAERLGELCRSLDVGEQHGHAAT